MSNDRTLPQGTYATVPTVDRMLPDGNYIKGTAAAGGAFKPAWAIAANTVISSGAQTA